MNYHSSQQNQREQPQHESDAHDHPFLLLHVAEPVRRIPRGTRWSRYLTAARQCTTCVPSKAYFGGMRNTRLRGETCLRQVHSPTLAAAKPTRGTTPESTLGKSASRAGLRLALTRSACTPHSSMSSESRRARRYVRFSDRSKASSPHLARLSFPESRT